MWDLIVSVPDHCLSFDFDSLTKEKKTRSSSNGTDKNNFVSGLKFISMNTNSIRDKKKLELLAILVFH